MASSRVAELVIKVTAETKQAASDISNAGSAGEKMRKGLSVASKGAAVALAAVGAAAISAGRAAAEDAQSQAILAKQMENSAGASKGQVAQMEDWISAASAASGVADDELRPAMSNLLRATGDATKSQKSMAVALDVAAATGKSVESVTQAMAKGYGGSATSLKKLVPTLSDAAVESGNMNQIMKELAAQTGGASAAAADTAAGKMQRFGLALGETQEAIGGALLPVMEKLSTILLQVATAAQEHPKLFVGIAVAVAVLAAGIIALNLAVTIYTAVTTLAGSATIAAWVAAAWPILAVVAAIGLVIGAVLLLWNKNEAFRTAVLAVWAAIKTAAEAVWSFLRGAFTAIWGALGSTVRAYLAVARAVFSAVQTAVELVIDKVGDLIAWIKRIEVPGAIKAAFEAIKDAVGFVKDRVGDLVARIKDIEVPGVIKTAFENVKTAVGLVVDRVGDLIAKIGGISVPGTIQGAIEGIKGAVDGAIGAVQSLINWLSRIKVPHINLPGGKSAPKAAVPAGPAAVGFRASTQASTRAMATGGTTIVVNGALDPEAVARQIQRILAGHHRRVGLRTA